MVNEGISRDTASGKYGLQTLGTLCSENALGPPQTFLCHVLPHSLVLQWPLNYLLKTNTKPTFLPI